MKKELKIGLFGIVALIILFLGIKFLKGLNIFRSTNDYYVAFHDAKGLSKNSKVYANGFPVGIVSELYYDYSHPGNILVEISLDPKVVIRTGTAITLDSGLMGGCTLNMDLQNNLGTIYQPGDTIRGIETSNIAAQASDLMPRVQELIGHVDSLIAAVTVLVQNPKLDSIIGNVELTTHNLTTTTARINGLLDDELPTILHTYNSAGQNLVTFTGTMNDLPLQQTLESVNQTLESVHNLVEGIQNPKGTIGLMLNDPSIYNNLNHTIQSADSLVTDLKAHPKRYVHFSVFGKKDK